MANSEHLKILKTGVAEWNRWRYLDLKSYDADLPGDLFRFSVDLSSADLRGSDLSNAELYYADLRNALLEDTVLSGVNFGGFWTTTNRGMVRLPGANLCGAKLNRSILDSVTFDETYLDNTDFGDVILARTRFLDVSLASAAGLETCSHHDRSYLDDSTLMRSGRLPLSFLRGCGLSDMLIDYLPSLLNEAIQHYSCFISYSNKDQAFAERLYSDLQNAGIRCWFAPEDLRIGDRFRTRIEESIRIYDKLLVILSENSIESTWVENEVEAALEREHQQNELVLFPIRLDSAIMQTDRAWAATLRRSRHIGDFSGWKTHDLYRKSFDRLMRDLKPPVSPV